MGCFAYPRKTVQSRITPATVPIPKLVCVTLSPLAGFIESHSRGNRSEVILNERKDLYENTVRHFNDAVCGLGAPLSTGEDGLRSLAPHAG